MGETEGRVGGFRLGDLPRLIAGVVDDVLGQLGTVLEVEPPAELRRTADGHVLVVALPGVAREALRLEVQGRRVRLGYERVRPAAAEGAEVRHERPMGRVDRTFTVPEPVDATRVRARLQHGLLVIELPRPAAETSHSIEIDAEAT